MRIGLNATCFDDRPSGANQRFRHLYGALFRRNRDVEYLIYEPADCRIASWFADLPNVVARFTPLPAHRRLTRLIKGIGYWPAALRADTLDLFETFSLPLVKAPDCPTVLTIHDLRPVHRETSTAVDRLIAQRVLDRAFDRADHVITVSKSVRTEILKRWPDQCVSVIHNGIDPDRFASPASDSVAAIRRRYALSGDFALCVGHLEPRKNLLLLIDAVAALDQTGRVRPLLIVGRDGGQRREILAHIARRRVAHLVTLIDDADDVALRSLYAASRLVVMASRDEGFGIPLLEAMAAGRPLVLSDTAVFREVTQDRGCYFPADDPQAAAEAIDRVWTNRALRDCLTAYGRSRASDFEFDTLADRLSSLHAALAPTSATPNMLAMRARAAAQE